MHDLVCSLPFSVRRGLSLYNHLHVRQDLFSLHSKISIAKQIAQVCICHQKPYILYNGMQKTAKKKGDENKQNIILKYHQFLRGDIKMNAWANHKENCFFTSSELKPSGSDATSKTPTLLDFRIAH